MTSPTTAAPNRLLIALIAVGAVLLLAVVAITFLLIGQNNPRVTSDAGVPNPTPTVTESLTPVQDEVEEPVDQPAAPDTSLRFTSFKADLTVECDVTGEAEEKAQPQISWASANAVHVYWTPNDEDADASNGYEVGASGNQNDMSASKGAGERYEFPCNHRETFDTTITLVGADGQKVSKHVTFTDVNWNTGGGDSDG